MQLNTLEYVTRVEYDERMYKIDQKIDQLTEAMIGGFERSDQKIAELSGRMITGFERSDRKFDELNERVAAGFQRHDQKFDDLTEIMLKGFDRLGADLRLIKSHLGIKGSAISN